MGKFNKKETPRPSHLKRKKNILNMFNGIPTTPLTKGKYLKENFNVLSYN